MFGVKTSVRISECNLNHLTNERKENHKTQEEKGRGQAKVIVGPATGRARAVRRRGEKKLRAARAPRLPLLPTPSLSSLRAISSIVPSTPYSHSNPDSIFNADLKTYKLRTKERPGLRSVSEEEVGSLCVTHGRLTATIQSFLQSSKESLQYASSDSVGVARNLNVAILVVPALADGRP